MKKLILLLLIMSNITFAKTNNEFMETVYLAGGCYWGLEQLIKQIPGVTYTEVGFSGGHINNVSYKEVTKGDTGHAETVKVEFNNTQLSLKELLLQFFRIHNPITINQQGNDIGTQYRSVIFYINKKQKEIIDKTIEIVNQSMKWESLVVTEVILFQAFYPAEEAHQQYLEKNSGGYSCHFVRDFDFN
ncbi:MAG: peptide-methionine (S)-S-oxide reductase MsrA [Methylophilaceae bacterium]